MSVQNDTSKDNELDPIRVAQTAIAAIALVGAGIERTLHYLLEGDGNPEYQYFVFQLAGTALCLFFLFMTLGAASLFAIDLGKADRAAKGIWKKRSIRMLAVLTVGFFLLFAYVFAELGAIALKNGTIPLIDGIKSQLATT